jgi:hypothetical protein
VSTRLVGFVPATGWRLAFFEDDTAWVYFRDCPGWLEYEDGEARRFVPAECASTGLIDPTLSPTFWKAVGPNETPTPDAIRAAVARRRGTLPVGEPRVAVGGASASGGSVTRHRNSSKE